MGLLHRASSRL